MLVICGAEGGAAGVNGALCTEFGLSPTAFAAETKQTWDTPLVSPDTVMGDVGLVPRLY
jgi:hypothetical protein